MYVQIHKHKLCHLIMGQQTIWQCVQLQRDRGWCCVRPKVFNRWIGTQAGVALAFAVSNSRWPLKGSQLILWGVLLHDLPLTTKSSAVVAQSSQNGIWKSIGCDGLAQSCYCQLFLEWPDLGPIRSRGGWDPMRAPLTL